MERYQNNIQDQLGNAISGVTVTVRTVSGGGLASLFSDDGVTGKANPFTNDADGELFFYAVNDRYDIFFTGAVTDQKDDVILNDPATGVLAPQAGSIRILTDIATATPATTEAVTGYFNIWDLDDDTELGRFGYLGNNTLSCYNLMRGGAVRFIGTDAGGTFRSILSGDPDVGVSLYSAGTLRLDTHTTGRVRIMSDGATDTEQRTLNFCHSDLTVRGSLGYLTDDVLTLRNLIHGGDVLITAEDAGGTPRTILTGDPDAITILRGDTDLRLETAAGELSLLAQANSSVQIYYDQSLKLQTQTTGIEVRGALNNSPGGNQDVRIDLRDASGDLEAVVGFLNSDTDFFIRSYNHAGLFTLDAEDTGGTARSILVGDPDVGVDIYYPANAQVNLRTSDEAGADIGMGAEVRHNDDSFYPVGMNVAPPGAALDSGNETLDVDNVGKMLTYNSATARSLLFNDLSDIKAGAMWALKVGPSAGVLTGDGGTGVVIRYWDGAAYTDTAAAGNITIGEGGYNIWKETDTLYWIEGPDLS